MPSRRDLLAGLAAGGVGALAGCSSRRDATGRWPRVGYDDRNTGYAPDVRAPGGSATVAWSFEFPRHGWYSVSSPVVAGDRAFVGYGEPATSEASARVGLRVLDLATGESVRDVTVATHEGSAPGRALHVDSTVVGDGSVYLLAWDGIYSYAPDGERRWRVSTGGVPDVSTHRTGHPVVVDDAVYATTAGFALMADAPAATEAVYAVDDATGEIRWRHETPERIYTPAYADETVYATAFQHGVVALDAATGEVRWERSAPVEGPPTVRDGRVYFPETPQGDPGTTLRALDAATGESIWSVDAPNPGPQRVAVADDRLFHRESATEVVAREAASGDVAWRTEAPGAVHDGSPTVTDDALYLGVGTRDGSRVVVLDPERGEKLGVVGRRDVNGELGSVALADGLAMVSNTSGVVYAVEACSFPLAGHCLG
jgi:outer membrane protein assembly factor BamB